MHPNVDVIYKKHRSVWQQLFDYYSGILSYAIQFIPVFIYHSYDQTSPGDLAGIISKVSCSILRGFPT